MQTPRPITDDDLVKLEGSGYNTDCAAEDNSPDCQTESDELIIPTTILKEDTTTHAEKPSNRITIKTILPMRYSQYSLNLLEIQILSLCHFMQFVEHCL